MGVSEFAWLLGIVNGIPQSAKTFLLMHGAGKKFWMCSGLLWISLRVATTKILSLFCVV